MADKFFSGNLKNLHETGEKMNFLRRRSIIYFLISLFLIIPLILRIIEPKLEAYPAILFPSGASILNANDTIVTFTRLEILAYETKKQTWTKLNSKDFKDVFSETYFPRIVSYGFGLQETGDTIRINRLGLKGIGFVKEDKTDIEDLLKTKAWLRPRLKKMGLEDSSIIARIIKVDFNTNERKIIRRTIKSEEAIKLF